MDTAALQLQVDLLHQEVIRLRSIVYAHFTPLENRGWPMPESLDEPNVFPQGVNAQG